MTRPSIHLALACAWLVAGAAQIASTAPPDPRFGAVESYLAPEQAAALNVGWDRMVIHWSQRQQSSPDQWYVPEEETQWLNTARETGREVVVLLMGTPVWATDGPPGLGVPRGLYLPVDDPGNLWAVFVRRMVTEYGGQIKHWIIWNEPDIAPEDVGAQFAGTLEDYYQLLKVAYLAAKAADPAAVIHVAGLTYWHDFVHGRRPYLERLLEFAGQDPTARAHNYYFDVATLHIYFKTETVYDIIRLHQNMLRRHGLRQPIWLNETNAAPMDDPQHPWPHPLVWATMDQQAAFVVQANALALAAGAARVAVYKLTDHAPPPPGVDAYGLFRSDGSARPAAEGFRMVTMHFSGWRTARLASTAAYHLVTLDRPTGVTRVAWARGAQGAVLRLRPTWSARSAALYDHLGEAYPVERDRYGYYAISLPGAECIDPNYGCVIGGSPRILVEYYRRASGCGCEVGAGAGVLRLGREAATHGSRVGKSRTRR